VHAREESTGILRFGDFELDGRNGELRKAGILVKLAPQPFAVLQLLARSGGELVSRDEIRRQIWGESAFGDFDRSLNVCIAQVRAALSDDPDSPRFIRTVPRRGYTFLAPVHSPPEPAATEPAPLPPRKLPRHLPFAIAVALLMIAGLAWRLNPSKPAPDTRIMLAVLPFENLGAADPFVDGLIEELITHLGSLHPQRLGVIGRSSVMRYRTQRSPANAGRELSVNYIVEGSVRADADRLRITARLVRVADQSVVWTDVFESASTNLFRSQPEAAARITGAVTSHLFPRQPAAQAPPHVAAESAYEAYTKGRYLQHKGTRAELERSLGFFETATRLDARFAEAFAAQADAFITMGRTGTPSAQAFPRAATAAKAALAANPASADAHNALANVLFWYEWEWNEAEQHFKRAIEINPSLAAAHHDYAWFLVARGRTEQGIISLRAALALDPLSYRVNIDAGWLLLHARKFDEAIAQARRALELEPGFNEAKACIARSLLFKKDYRAALEHLSAINPQLTAAQPAQDAEATIRKAFRKPAGSQFTAATQYAFNNENAKALDALERAFAARSIMLVLLNTEPSFTGLREDPRFQNLARRIGL